MRFKKSDRRALLIIFVAVAASWTGIIIDRWLTRAPENVLTIRTWEEDSVLLDSIYDAKRKAFENRQHSSQGTYDAIPERTVETFPFDPNTADSTVMLRLGLSPWQVRSIIKYRAKGGRYHRPEDFQRVPGMTPEVWDRLAPAITIGKAFRYYHEPGDTTRRAASHDSTSFPKQEKFKDVVQLNLNTADSASLKMIPGIASVRARRIMRYRDDLGGFVSVEQLREVEGLPSGLEQWFKVETGVFRRLRINDLSVKELARHPYISYTQARAIVTYRRNYGQIKSLGDLSLLDEFTEDDFHRLEPYIEF